MTLSDPTLPTIALKKDL